MTHDNTDTSDVDSGLHLLVGRDLSSVEFVRDYLQLRFDGLTLNAITMPQVRFGAACFVDGLPGYRDAICDRIGSAVTAASETPDVAISIQLSDGWEFQISLRPDDYRGPEAALFRDDVEGGWTVW